MKIKIGARGSKLSRQQVEEVMEKLAVDYTVQFVETVGDRNLETSLKQMDKTDFFTREIDQMVLTKQCDVGIHSAKDLPVPLPKGLKLIALTEGVDGSDSLVFREGECFERLKKGAVIGSSSLRRDKGVKQLRSDLQCVEVRGGVDRRLALLDRGEIDGLIVAEAALIRLGLTKRRRITLPIETPPLQGKLAVVGRQGDDGLSALFHAIDSQKQPKALYLGLDPKHYGKEVLHCPLIEVVPRAVDHPDIIDGFSDMPNYTHLIFTSKSGVDIFFSLLEEKEVSVEILQGKQILAVGKITAKHLEEKGIVVDKIAKDETQEGIIDVLALEDLRESYLFIPQSSRARKTLSEALARRGVRHRRCFLYDTKVKFPPFNFSLERFEEIIFTSPSTVDAFREIFGPVPWEKKITAIGPITEHALKEVAPGRPT